MFGFNRRTKPDRKVTRPSAPSLKPRLELLEDRTAPASFQGLGSIKSQAFGVSADGSVVVGIAPTASGAQAFRWTAGGGMVGLGSLPGRDSSQAHGVSADGSVVVGVSWGGRRYGVEAFRWTSGGGMISLGNLPTGTSFASESQGVSADGSIIVGGSTSHSGYEAFRWTSSGGMVGLGDLGGGDFSSYAKSISADGSVIVGYGTSIFGLEAYRWTAGGGMAGLGDLGGGGFGSFANGVSADGSVIVGYGTSIFGAEAFRWTAGGGMVGLGDLGGGGYSSQALGVSADGSVVVGAGHGTNSTEAFIWDANTHMRSLQQVLINDFGLATSLAGWTLGVAAGISADGRTIVGHGRNPSGNIDAWIARIDSPADIDMQSAQLQSGNTVQFTYATTGTPGPFQAGLYRSTDGITYNPADLIATQTVTPSPTNPQTPGMFTLPNPWTPDPSKPFLIIVADPPSAGNPKGAILESNDTESGNGNNVASIQLPDIAITAFSWNVATGVVNGLDIRYEIKGSNLPEATDITLFWANGNLIVRQAFVMPAQSTVGVHIQHVPLTALAPAPFGTTRLILAADPPAVTQPQGKILEPNEGNNVRVVMLYALKTVSIAFDAQIADRVDRLASDYYRATGKILVFTSGLRTPQEEAQAIARLISVRIARGETIQQALRHVRDVYENGHINRVLRDYDRTKSPDENVPTMAAAISQLLDNWNQGGRRGRPPISYHLAGWAVDVSTRGMTASDQIRLRAIAWAAGAIPGGNEGGDPHIHISFPRFR